MSIVSISRIQHRKGLQQDLPQLASAELGWSIDTQQLYIGNGTIAEGAPKLGNTEILTTHSEIIRLAETYTFRNTDAGYTPTTGGKASRFTSLAYGNNIYVAVGTDGTILISYDSISWTPTYSGTSAILNYVCYGNGIFVIVGVNGILLTSTDGIVWEQSSNAIYLSINSVVYAAGSINKFIAVSTIGTIISSTDGITWSIASTPTSENLFAVDYYSGELVAVGSNGKILTSTDSSTWTSRTSGTTNDLRTVKYVNDRWIAAGANNVIISSTDSINWDYGYSDAFKAAANDGTTWVFVGYGGITYTTTNTTLSIQNSTTLENLNDIIYVSDTSTFIAVGDNGIIVTSNDSGVTWVSATISSSNLNSIVYNGSTMKYVIVGNLGTILNSSDGTTWTTVTGTGITANLNSIAIWNNAVYITVGAGGVIYTSSNPVTTWTAHASGVPNDLYSVTVGNLGGGTFEAVAVGKNGILVTSSNVGLSWIARSSGVYDHLHGVNYIQWTQDTLLVGQFFAVGNNGNIITSNNGVSWSVINYPTVSHLQNVYYGVGNFWIVGSIGYTVLFGADLTQTTTITAQSLGALYTSSIGYNGPTIHSVSYGLNLYTLVGQYDSIFTSTNGVIFTSQAQRSFSLEYLNSADIYDCKFINNQFLAVGTKGLILTSSNGVSWNGKSYVYGNTDTVRTLQKKLDDFVNVKDFGAQGDGTSDDTESINRALYEIYCRTLSPASRKKLYFPAGTYIVSDGIRVPSYAILQGEGSNNSIIVQTADPSLVSYAITTADSKQQIEGQVGYNGAVLPTDITISDLGIQTTGDGIWIAHCNNATFARLKITGSLNYPSSAGSERVGFYILGASMTAPTDISISDSVIQKFNYGIEQRSNESSRNVVINSTTFNNLYIGIKLCHDNDGGIGRVNTMTISNSAFDSIATNAIVADNSINITSTFNSFRDVGNNYLGTGNAAYPIIDFSNGDLGCASIGDQFDRTVDEHESFPWVAGSQNIDAWHNGKEIRQGLLTQQAGKMITLIPNQINVNTGIEYIVANNTFNQRIQYMISRNGMVRSGILQCTYIDQASNIDDDSSQTDEVGVTFSLSSDGSKVYLQYSSTAVAGNITMSYAEKSIKSEW